jgi:glycosyltransferase involved in cell wall biosynthesis
MFQTADHVIVLSDSWRKAVETACAPIRNISVVHNPAPCVALRQHSQPSERIILFAGLVGKRKGVDVLLPAFAAFRKSHPDWRLVIAGNGDLDWARSLANDCGIGQYVTFPGWIAGEAKDRMFRGASLFCLPSRAEGFAMGVIEAAAYGIPVVTTPVGGVLDAFQAGSDLAIVPVGDVAALSATLAVLADDEQKRCDMRTRALDVIRDNFQVNVISEEISGIYRRLIEKNPNASREPPLWQ